MTGHLQWLSQAPLENRKADKLITLEAPRALRGIQSAERDVARAAHRADVADRKRAISARFAALLSAAEQQIIAHVQRKIAAIDPTLSPAARRAAIEQLVAEQAAALARLRQDIVQQRRQARRAVARALNSGFKRRNRSIVAQHAIEREQSHAMVGAATAHRKRLPRAFAAIRQIVHRLDHRRLRRRTQIHLGR